MEEKLLVFFAISYHVFLMQVSKVELPYKAVSYANFSQLGGHHERGHAIVVEHILQVAVWVEFGTFNEQQVVHLSDEACVVPSVVSDVDQGVQDCVSP